MNKNKFRRLVFIHMILIIILIGLAIKITEKEDSYSCDKCEIEFTKWQSYGPDETKLTVAVPLQRLYQSYLENECPIKWDKANSYIFAEEFDVIITGN